MPPMQDDPVNRTAVSIGVRWRRRLRNASARSGFELYWLLPVWLLLGVSRASILGVPFRHLARLMGRQQGPHAWTPLLTEAQRRRSFAVGRTVRLAARYTPWISNCFPQALAASVLLRLYRVPYALHLGLAPGGAGQPMRAHAWVVSGPVRVTGGESFREFTVVGCFVGAAGGSGSVP